MATAERFISLRHTFFLGLWLESWVSMSSSSDTRTELAPREFALIKPAARHGYKLRAAIFDTEDS